MRQSVNLARDVLYLVCDCFWRSVGGSAEENEIEIPYFRIRMQIVLLGLGS